VLSQEAFVGLFQVLNPAIVRRGSFRLCGFDDGCGFYFGSFEQFGCRPAVGLHVGLRGGTDASCSARMASASALASVNIVKAS
jgi:hypothetical protein